MQLTPRSLFAGLTLWFAGLSLVSAGPGAESPANRFEFRLPHRAAYRLETNTVQALAAGQRPQWLKAHPAGSTNAIEFGSRIVVQLKANEQGRAGGAGAEARLKQLLADSPEGQNTRPTLARTVTPNVFILQASDAFTAAREAHRLAALPEVEAAYPVVRQRAQLQGPYYPYPSDGFFNMEWYLEQRNSDGSHSGADLNVRAAWPYTLGEGVTIGIVDSGIEMAHPELADRVAGAPHYNFLAGTATNVGPFDTSAYAAHGTEVAGLAAASINNGRMVGTAPGASLASWVISSGAYILATDEQLMEMYQYQSNVVSVQNHSWGLEGVSQGGPTLLEQIGISNAVTAGRFGRGVVMVRSAGNSRTAYENGVIAVGNANDNGYGADPRTIGVAATRADGRAASYSSPGASILVATPGGDGGRVNLFTTDLLGNAGANYPDFCSKYQPDCPYKDLNNYVLDTQQGLKGFSGTSAAAPQISGIAALMLSANPSLSYRDVQQILILSARHFDFADPDLRTNGAGFVVSHNVGFGVPDAGVAVDLARHWNSRPEPTEVVLTATNPVAIPDAGLRLLVSGSGVPPELSSIECRPSYGPEADTPTASLPLADFGNGLTASGFNLTNQAALYRRSLDTFYNDSIRLAAQAGASFAVIYNFGPTNDTGGEVLKPMAGTDFVPIPAVFIGQNEGEALKALCQTNPSVTAQISLNSASYVFNVTNTLICEHVGLRVQTDHPSRSELRITLVSPMGTRSVLQRFNGDPNGLVDWTYYSTHHFFESTAGQWTVYVSDEASGNTGSVQQVSLILNGVPIRDRDADGLDDFWEVSYFNCLYAQGPRDDGDKDGYSNAREQLMGTDPTVAENLVNDFNVDLSWWNSAQARLSWPASPYWNYEVWTGTNAAALNLATNLPGKWPVSEWFGPRSGSGMQFYRVRATAK